MKRLFLLLLSAIMLTFTTTGCGLIDDEFMDELRQEIAEGAPISSSSADSNDNGVGEPGEAVYSNEQLGIRFTLPRGFVMSDDTGDTEEISPEIDAVTEMEVESPSDETTLFLLSYEDANMTEENAIAMQRALNEEMRFRYEGDFEAVQLAGQDFWYGKSRFSFLGVVLLQEEYIAKRNDRIYLLSIIYSPDTVDERDALLAGFSAY